MLLTTDIGYCPRCGDRLEERYHAGRQRLACPACGFVWYQNPLPVAACVVETDGAVVLIRRRLEPGRGRWALPAGFIEHGETPAEAAARETLEETGLRVAVRELVGVYAYVEAGGRRSGIVIAYSAAVTGGSPVAGDDAEAVRLVVAADPPVDLAFATHQAALHDWARQSGLTAPAWLTARVGADLGAALADCS